MRAPHEDKDRPSTARTAPVDPAEAACATSPLIAQYLELKGQYPEALLLSRVGDFYEAYGDDALELAGALNIVCTSKEAGKGRRVAMSGVPHHSVDHYLAKLLRQRRIVAIAEQMEEPTGKRLVRREIVRVLTPGTVLEDQFLNAERNNYLCAVASAAGVTALAAADVSTSSAWVSIVDNDDVLASELDRLSPAELVVQEDEDVPRYRPHVAEHCRITLHDPSFEGAANGVPLPQLAVADRPAAREALALLQRYLNHLRLDGRSIVERAAVFETRTTMALDRSTRRHLDLLTGSGTSKAASLLGVICKTKTPMGTRLIAQWLCAPLLDLALIARRHDNVEVLVSKPSFRLELQHVLAQIGDIERLVQKVHARRAGPRDLVGLRRSLESVERLADCLGAGDLGASELLSGPLAGAGSAAQAARVIAEALTDEPSATLVEGGVIRPEFNAALGELLSLRTSGREHLLGLEAQVRAETGIKSLKIKYTQAFGYYYEVTRNQAPAMPPRFVRRQSLANVERFSDERLSQLESRLVAARGQQVALERQIFEELVDRTDAFRTELLACGRAVAELDVFCSLAQVASERRYVRPSMTQDSIMMVEGGRHPVIEAYGGVDFVPNTCQVDGQQRFLLITGPNMGGKSTFLRQTALACVLAQMGSWVPASAAKLGVVDRLFTRIGADDDLAAGRSTFYVEMAEMAQILRNCTPRSLLLVDEVGRGTGTTDGLAIAQAISEYLLNLGDSLPIVLFATHFHELVDLARHYPAMVNLHVVVADEATGPVFSHRLLTGSSSRSYGIAVAKMAGLPRTIVERAQEIAVELELRPTLSTKRLRQAESPADQLDLL